MQSKTKRLSVGSEELNELKDNFNKAKMVLANHKIALWEYDVKTDTAIFSEGYFDILGLTQAGIRYSNLEEMLEQVHPQDKEGLAVGIFNEKLKQSEKEMMECLRLVGKKGQVVWLEDNLFSVRKDKNGKPRRFMFYTENITEWCEKEIRIRRLEERNRKIIEALPEFIFILDDNFFIRDVLMAEGTTLLHSKEELIGIDGRKVYSPEVSDLFLRSIQACLENGQLQEIEYPLDMPGKGRYYFQARIAPFEKHTVLALIHDIGDRVLRSAELLEAKRKAEESDKMKSYFLASMSHEIRTPLNAIIGFSEMLALTEDNAERDEYIGIIRQNSNLLLQLINDILDLSRIESGKSEMNIQPAEITGLMDEAEKVHRIKMKAGVSLKLENPRKKIWTLTDRNRVMQVLFNFLSNAIKNTEQGSITLRLEEEKGWLKMSVSDTGCGIPEDKLPKIFTRFEKLNDFVQGTGLGLSICESIAKCLGGKIKVDSKVGEGSTFALYIPYYNLVKPKLLDSNRNDLQMKTPESCRKKILVAEDIESAFIQVNTTLHQHYTVSWARDGQEAVNNFMQERPQLVLMDIRMPIMDGVEAIKLIRAVSKEVPIVAITAHSYYIEQQQALSAGCNEILTKPFSAQQLEECIQKYLLEN